MNTAKKIIEQFGGQSALAEMIGKNQSTVGYWAKKGTIPSIWQAKLLEIAKTKDISLTADDFIGNIKNTQNHSNSLVKFAKHKGELILGSSSVDCYVLNTGERVISMRATVKAIANIEAGNLGDYIGVESLKLFINKEKILGEALTFNIPGSHLQGNGITAESFLDVCRGYLEALKAGALKTDRQKEIAISCSILIGSCAKVGLIALIDEATGYQYEREDDALRVKLKAYIADELRAWEKTFPDELWEEFGRLTGWKGSLQSRPKWWGKLVIELIYETLDKDVASYLKDNKPPAGVKWFQQLTDNYGARQLVSRCFEIIGMAKTCTTMNELRTKVAHHYGKEPIQLTLYMPIRPD